MLQLQHQLRFTQDELQKCHENNAQAQNEKKELQAKLLNETEERERVQLQLHQMREQARHFIYARFCDKRPAHLLGVQEAFVLQVADLDKSLEVTRQELGKLRTQADKEDERWRSREQELLVYLEESHSHERKLEGQKHNLEVCLADATQQMQELEVPERHWTMLRRLCT